MTQRSVFLKTKIVLPQNIPLYIFLNIILVTSNFIGIIVINIKLTENSM